MKQFACGSVVPDCTALFRAETEDEIMRQVATHAREEHGIPELPSELQQRVKARIADV